MSYSNISHGYKADMTKYIIQNHITNFAQFVYIVMTKFDDYCFEILVEESTFFSTLIQSVKDTIDTNKE